MNFKKNMFVVGASVAIAAAINVQSVQAFNLNSVKSVAGLGSTSQSSSVGDFDSLTNQQQELMSKFTSSMKSMLMAQSKTLEAAGYKEQADLAKATAANYASGNVNDPKAIERDTKITVENQEKIDKFLAENAIVSAEGKAALIEAVPFYAQGMVEGSGLPDAFESWSSNAQDGVKSLSSNPLQARKLVTDLNEAKTVVVNLPKLVSSWTSTTKSFIAFAKSNDVDVTDVESKLGDL